MKKSVVVCLLLAFVMVVSTFAMAEAVLGVTGTDVTGTDVTGTDVTGSDVTGSDVTNTDTLLCGDVNFDGVVNAKDALEILKACVERVTFTDVQIDVADVYQDDEINAKDALYVLHYTVENITSLPYNPADVTGTDVTGSDVTATNA